MLKLSDALQIIQQRNTELSVFRVALVCGFTPLHLRTFIQAQLLLRFGDLNIEVDEGLYGDLVGNLNRLKPLHDAAAIVIEWSDLDSRLGVRKTGGWRIGQERDIVATVGTQLDRLRVGIETVATEVVVSLPTVPFPPCFVTPPDRGNATAFQLREKLYSFAASIAGLPGVSVLEPYAIDGRSGGDRFQICAELSSGFPYQILYASKLADCLAKLIRPAPPKKAIITDLDNTLWRGIVGEVGVDGVSWHLDRGSHEHALYQQLLASFADTGVLLAVATKNDPTTVHSVLKRMDMVFPSECLFPIEAHWGPKSDSVGRILDAWNIGAESVVFVDDSPLELAEVGHRFSEVQCLQFPTGDAQAVYELLGKLRRLFGKSVVSEEDRLRATSVKTSAEYARTVSAADDQDQFLSTLDAQIGLRFGEPSQRTFELINKTNQFNLNGCRIDRASWLERTEDHRSFAVTVDYRDKFGPLGQVAVASGLLSDVSVVDVFVLSCRAFSRRIEHQIVKALFEYLSTDVLRFEFEPTPRNGPLQEFFELCRGAVPTGVFELSKQDFMQYCPQLFAKVNTNEHSRDAA